MLLAFHGQQAIKDLYLARVRAHQEADEIKQRWRYWTKGKGCAVGCTIHGADHFAYEKELGIPIEIAVLEDRIFELLSYERSQSWPAEFLSAIEPGADLSDVFRQFSGRTGDDLEFWLRLGEAPIQGVIRFTDGVFSFDQENKFGENADRLLDLLRTAPVPGLIKNLEPELEPEEVGELVTV